MLKTQALPKPMLRIISWSKSNKIKTAIIVAILLLLILWALSAFPRSVAYSFSNESCSNRLTLMPNWQNSGNSDINYEYKEEISALGYPIVSKKVCFKLAKMVEDNNSVAMRLYPFDFILLGQNYSVDIPKYPDIETGDLDLKAVPLTNEISFPLNQEDKLFQYRLNINDSKVNCLANGKNIECAVNGLSLKHNTEYSADIDRIYNEEVKPVVSLDIKTIEPVSVIGTSVDNGEKVPSILDSINIKTDRGINSVEGLALRSEDQEYKVTSEIRGDVLVVKTPKDLPRGENYKLKIDQIFGTKKETLPKPFELEFSLMEGPASIGSNLKDRAVPLSSSIRVYFNQKIEDTNYTDKISLTQNGTKMEYSTFVNGSSLVINPNYNFDKCADINIVIKGMVNNTYGVGSDIKWQQKTRAKCATSFSLGSSKNGRGIIGYRYGNGSNEILYVGALHGDEYNSKRILEEWMWEIEGNPSKIPANSRITVVPVLNPDGIAKSSRYNSSGVDLNRNFPAFNWKSDIVIQGGSTLENGGGESPLSEPESTAIANYISDNRPRLVLTYHSQGNIVESNEAGIANNYSQKYSSLSGYGYKLASSNAGFFKYDVNGSLEEWAKDKLGQPVILVELSTRIYHDFSRNKNAMWAMLQ